MTNVWPVEAVGTSGSNVIDPGRVTTTSEIENVRELRA